jgi:hypothetical protein
MNDPVSKRQQQMASGPAVQYSFWLRHELVEKLDRIAAARGVKRNRALSQLVLEAEDPAGD